MKTLLFLMLIFITPSVQAQDSFNIQMEIPDEYAIISPGEEVLTSIKLMNLASDTRMDVIIEFWITSPEKTNLLQKTETIAIETQASLVRTFEIPVHSKEGKYNVYAKVVYGEGREAVANNSFMVKEDKNSQIAYYVLGTIVVFALLIFATSKSKGLLKRIKMKAKIARMVKKKNNN